jgi:hypothetical protein
MTYNKNYYIKNIDKYRKGGQYYYYKPKKPPIELKRIDKKIIIYFD